jgi:glycine dehydrogenase subunit 2
VALKAAVGKRYGGTHADQSNTVGIFEKGITQIAKIVHEAGGLPHYDGATLYAIMGTIRPGDMGYGRGSPQPLHKTYSTASWRRRSGRGPVGCKKALAKSLPGPIVVKTQEGLCALGVFREIHRRVKTFYGNFLVGVPCTGLYRSSGLKKGLNRRPSWPVLNANYMMARLKGKFPTHSSKICMHEFVVSCEEIKKEIGVSALDFAKAMIDRNMHPPTIYFPLIVHEALMFEPTETESKATLDWACDTVLELLEEAYRDPAAFKKHPCTMPIDVARQYPAARKPVI